MFGISEFGTALINNAEAASREHAARYENYRYGEMAADNADARTRALYRDLYSIEAQMQQMRNAGLSPSVFYGDGISGVSGHAGAEGTGASGIAPTTFGIPPLEFSQELLNLAQARKLNAEADTEEGTNKRGEAEISNIVQSTATSLSQMGLNYSSQRLVDADAYGQRLSNALANKTFDDNAKYIKYLAKQQEQNATKALYEAGKAKIDFQIADETKADQVKYIQDNVTKQLAEIMAIRKGTELTEMEMKNLESGIAQKWEEIRVQTWNATSYADYVENQNEYWKNYLENFQKSLKVEERGQNLRLTESIIDAGTAVINSGMNTIGTVYMADTYKEVGGKPTTTTTTKYNQYGRPTGWTQTIKK